MSISPCKNGASISNTRELSILTASVSVSSLRALESASNENCDQSLDICSRVYVNRDFFVGWGFAIHHTNGWSASHPHTLTTLPQVSILTSFDHLMTTFYPHAIARTKTRDTENSSWQRYSHSSLHGHGVVPPLLRSTYETYDALVAFVFSVGVVRFHQVPSPRLQAP